MATNRHLTRLIAAGAIGRYWSRPHLLRTEPIPWLKKARDASELLSGDQRECVESRIGRSNAERVENGRLTKAQATRYFPPWVRVPAGMRCPVRTTRSPASSSQLAHCRMR